MPAAVGMRLGNYEIVGLLDKGGIREVVIREVSFDNGTRLQ
jgi:hypothetical protein